MRGNALTDRGNVLTDRGNALTDRGNVLTDRGNALTDHGNALTDRGNALTDRGNALTDRGNVLTDRGNALTDHGNVLTDRGNVLTDRGNALTDRGNVLTDRGNALTDHGNALTDRRNELTDRRNELTERRNELTERRNGLSVPGNELNEQRNEFFIFFFNLILSKITTMKKIILLIFIIFIINDLNPCTIAIVSGKLTPDGRPLLWKNRDTDELNNKLMYFSGEKFDFIGLVNSPDTEGKEVWVGMNSAGFAIMNSVSYNIYLKNDVQAQDKDKEGIVMKLALETCATVDEFEKLLNSLEKPMGLETNFGVIDALGNGAFFETDHWHYKKYDLNDAPEGYMLRTNFSYSGETDKGQGYERYLMEEQLFKEAFLNNDISVKFILQDAARCLKHGLTQEDLTKAYTDNPDEVKFVPFMDFISRHSTSASVVIQGAKNVDDIGNMIMWTVLGFPPCSVSYPVWFNDEKVLPDLLKADSSGFAPLCNMALELKKKCFPVTRGRGTNYVNINALCNGAGTGIMQVLKPLDDEILSLKVPDSNPALFYKNLDKKIQESFLKLLSANKRH